MKIFVNGAQERKELHRLFVTPGKDDPSNSAWIGEDQLPMQLTVTFVRGVAEVDDQLGRYLIKKGLAEKSRTRIKRPTDEDVEDYG